MRNCDKWKVLSRGLRRNPTATAHLRMPITLHCAALVRVVMNLRQINSISKPSPFSPLEWSAWFPRSLAIVVRMDNFHVLLCRVSFPAGGVRRGGKRSNSLESIFPSERGVHHTVRNAFELFPTHQQRVKPICSSPCGCHRPDSILHDSGPTLGNIASPPRTPGSLTSILRILMCAAPKHAPYIFRAFTGEIEH